MQWLGVREELKVEKALYKALDTDGGVCLHKQCRLIQDDFIQQALVEYEMLLLWS